MKEVHFTIPGPPVGKERPRVVNKVAYTPKKTKLYEAKAQAEYYVQCQNYRFPDDALLDMRIIAYYGIAKSNSKKVKAWKKEGTIRPNIAPDIDNCLKAVADSLNGIAYRDDTQIVDCEVRKFYADIPRVEVRLIEVGRDPTKQG